MMHDQPLPTSAGLLRCLQALADEVESLGLPQTHLALQQAIILCRAETRIPQWATQTNTVGLIN